MTWLNLDLMYHMLDENALRNELNVLHDVVEE